MVTVSNNDNGTESSGLRTLDRGLAILEVLATEPDGPTMRQLSDALGLNLTTCYHLVNTLLDRGYLTKGSDRRVRLGSAIGTLYGAYARQMRPERELLPVLAAVSSRTEETAYLATWEDGDVVLRSVVEGPQHLRVAGLSPGLRGAAHSRASGKAMLAYLEERELTRFLETHTLSPKTERTITDPDLLRLELAKIARCGVAKDDGEFTPDVFCVAAPYFDAAGRVAGALTVSLPLSRREASEAFVVEAVQGAGEKASRAMGYSGPYPLPAKES